jgi:hypothetical protein
MNLKSKLFGFGAASLLALSMTSGVMAQESKTATANFIEGQCTFSVDTLAVSFGSWTWAGGTWNSGENTVPRI